MLAKSIEVNLPLGPRRCLFMAWSHGIEGPGRIPVKDVRGIQERRLLERVRAVRGRTIEFEAPARRAVEPSGAPFPDIFRERLRVSRLPSLRSPAPYRCNAFCE